MRARAWNVKLRFSFGFEHLAATVKTGRADMVTQMDFAGGGFHGNARHVQCVVRTVHTALGRGFFVLLDGHDSLLTDDSVGKFAPNFEVW